jgi:carbon-monoxide dehydrogenase large subunit
MVDRFGGLLKGEDRYVGDLSSVVEALELVFVRSPVSHGRISGLETEKAAGADGVVAVYTAADLSLSPVPPVAGEEGLAEPPLARGVVRYAGERVVAVVAESRALAEDAADLVVVEYEPLPGVTDARAAEAAGAPLLFPDRGSNVVVDLPKDGPPAPFEAEVVVHADFVIPRLSVAPMEAHAVLVVPDAGGRLTVWCSTQAPHLARGQLARALAWDPARIRVIAPAVGGGFGGKAGGVPPEHFVVAAAALKLERPVRFVQDRASNLVGMQGRGVHQQVRLHARRDGRLVALEADVVSDAGAYPSVAAIEPVKMKLMASGPYRIPVVDFTARSVLTNLAPTGAYRGPGRSEAAALLERSLDLLAVELDLDPVELRRRNLLDPTDFPCTSPTGMTYDSGDHEQLLERLVAAADYDALRAEQRRRRAAGGPQLGIGVATVIDSTAWAARTESAELTVERDGRVVVKAATASAGQEHGVAFARLVTELLPITSEAVTVIEGDTDLLPSGGGTSGSRSAQLAGVAVQRAAEEVASAARRLAARLLEAADDDVVLHRGTGFGVRGVPARAVLWSQLAEVAHLEAAVAGNGSGAFASRCVYEQSEPTHPGAAHLSVVEVDVVTGEVVPVRHVAVTDAGRILDLPSAHGQVVGASVQGIAQALYEQMIYDAAGNPLTTTLAEYLVPSAADVPAVESLHIDSRSPINAIGAKGIGEIGMVGAPVAVQNAVIDALSHLGVRHIDMPCTPEKVWRAVNAARPR